MVYGNEFYYQFFPVKGEVKAMAFNGKNILSMNKIKSKYTCLGLNDPEMFEKSASVKEFLLFGCQDNETGQSEVMVGLLVQELTLFKRILLNIDSPIRKILPLNDLFSFIVVTESGHVHLCDLSMKQPKEIKDICIQNRIFSSAVL